MTKNTWQKPSQCGIGACPQVKIGKRNISVRSTLAPRKIAQFTRKEWTDLTSAIKRDEFAS